LAEPSPLAANTTDAPPRRRSWSQSLLEPSLRTKVLGVAIAMNVVTVGVLTWQSSVKLQRVYATQLGLRGEALTRSAVAALEPALLDNDAIKSGAVLNSLKQIPGVAYALVQDPSGRLVAHTFGQSPPAGIAGLHGLLPGQAGALTTLVVVDGRQVMDSCHPLLQGALGSLRIGMDLSEARAEVGRHVVQGTLVALLVVSLGSLGLWFLLGLLVAPVNQLAEATRLIAEKGDLTQDLYFTRTDEVGRLGRNFHLMLVRLREIPHRLEQSVQLLTGAVDRLDRAAAEQGLTVAQQATALHQTQTTAEELRQASRQAAERAREILSSSKEADSVSLQGEAAVQHSLARMDEMKEQSSQTAERINALQRRMGQVRAIADTVKDLADQSNMLALNAAIEAVRSGEHGKGFALVAREIRRLADQSIQATDQVREILESVASELNEAVEVAGRGARRMEGEMAEVRKSGRSLSSLADLVRTTAGSVGQIATAVTQQDEGIGHIFGAVTRQSEMMERTQVQLGEVRASLDQLKALSASLTDMVGQYRT